MLTTIPVKNQEMRRKAKPTDPECHQIFVETPISFGCEVEFAFVEDPGKY